MHFLFFSPAQPHQKKGSLFVAKPLMSLFTGNVLGKTCGMQPTNSAVTVPCQARAQLQFSGSICTSKSRIIVCIMVIHIGPKSWLQYLLRKTVVLILETYSALWLPVKNKTVA